MLGAGLIGRRHIETIMAAPHAAQLVAVADPVADPSTFDLGGAPWFTDTEDMLDRIQPEALVIATPNALHGAQCKLACARGIHFLVEKPVTADLDAAADLVRAVDASGVKTLVGHHRRYLAAIQEARRRIAAGALGTLVAASVVWATRKPDAYFDTAWRSQPGGGPLLINAIHEIDMLRYLCGEVHSIGGIASNKARGFAVEDSAAAMFEFESGCLGTLICTDAAFSPWTIEQGTNENPNFAFTQQSAYRLMGTAGSLELPVLRSWDAKTPGDIGWDRPIVGTALTVPHHDPYTQQLEHFQRLVRLDEAPIVSVRDGANTLAATLAVAQSAREGRRVTPRRF